MFEQLGEDHHTANNSSMQTPGSGPVLAHVGTPDRVFIPADIICCIVEHCKRDKPALQRLSLVSREWLSLVSPILFAHITISEQPWGKDLSLFLPFLDQGPFLKQHVKGLDIRGGRMSVLDLLKVIGYLPMIQTLGLHHVVIFDPPELPTPSSAAFLPIGQPSPHLSLQRLSAICCDIASSRYPWLPLFQLINTFSSIETLVLDELLHCTPDYHLLSGPLPASPPLIRPGSWKTNVGRLSFIPYPDYFSKEFISCTLQYIDMRNLQYVFLEPREGTQPEELQVLLEALPDLPHLEIPLREFGELTLGPLSLTPCRSLREIAFSYTVRSNSDPEYTRFELQETVTSSFVMVSSLAGSQPSVTASHAHPLSTVLYKYSIPFTTSENLSKWEETFETIRWSELSSALTHRSFQQLKKVELKFIFLPTPTRPSGNFIEPPPTPAETSLQWELLRGLAEIVKHQLKDLSNKCDVNVDARLALAH